MTSFRFQKYDGTPHWLYLASTVAEGRSGQWFLIPRGTLESRPGRSWHTTADGLILLPDDGSWCARIQELTPAATYEVYVDVTCLLKRDKHVIEMVDLDLDVVKHRGRVWIEDQEEFKEHSHAMHSPSDLVARAQQTSKIIKDRVVTQKYPFDLSYHQRYASLIEGKRIRKL